MKLLLAGGLALLCNVATAQKSEIGPQKLSSLEWLEGNWSRKDNEAGKNVYETWIKTSDEEFTGMGITMRGDDTTFVEKLRIVSVEGVLCYEADVPENPEPVYFKFTELTDSSFECENLSHDFPKKISYSLDGELLTATISGNGQQIEFFFERRDP